MRKIGMVTIGQSPREDVLSVMRPHLPKGLEVVQRGALDNLDRPAIRALAPRPGQPLLVTKLRDGAEVLVDYEKLVPLMQACLDDLASEDVACVVVLCTGDFEELRADRLVLHPGTLARALVKSLVSGPGARVGVVLPSADQIPQEQRACRARWGDLDVVFTSASPYSAPETRLKEWKRVGAELRQADVEISYLDCIGMDEAMKRIVQEATGRPAVLASSNAARVAGELLAG